jgi:hypothetical protein
MGDLNFDDFDKSLFQTFKSELRQNGFYEPEENLFEKGGAYCNLEPVLIYREVTYVVIRFLYVPEQMRGKGLATKALNGLMRASDEAQLPLIGWPSHFELEDGIVGMLLNGEKAEIIQDADTTEWEEFLIGLGFERNPGLPHDHSMMFAQKTILEYVPKTPEEMEEEETRRKKLEDEKSSFRTRLSMAHQRHPNVDFNKLITVYSLG